MKRAFTLPPLLKENRWFFLPFGLFLAIGALLLLQMDTGDEIFFFSDRRTFFGDLFFRYFTRAGEELGYFLALGILLFVRYRHAVAIPLLGLSVGLMSFLAKAFFRHDRPFPYLRKLGLFDQVNVVDGVTLNGGANSFPSGHTMSAFALFAFLALCLPRKRFTGPLLFLAALLVGISRIYLVQHFLKDIYIGAILGVLIALSWHYLQYRFRAPWMEQRLGWRGGRVVKRETAEAQKREA